MSMATLHIRNLPEDVREGVVARSRRLGVTMSEYVTRVLRSDLAHPLFEDWAESVYTNAVPREIDVIGALDAARDEYDPLPLTRDPKQL
jgi:plasmid stability protein